MEDYWSKHCECGVPILGKETGGHESWTTRYCIIWRVASKHTIYIYVRIYIYIYIYISNNKYLYPIHGHAITATILMQLYINITIMDYGKTNTLIVIT
jgi:hypothetical protein